ncbi:MAG TPA: transcriptional repressor [Acidimicrobiales bacterium]|nr:transcriptional repressor [Acidimicrobiales bacterium]
MGRSPAPPDVPRQPPATVDDVLALVRASGGRATHSRRVLLEVLFDVHRAGATGDGAAGGPAGHHRTAEELAEQVQQRAPDVALSTIYRNLDDLQALGVVVHSHLGHGPATYQLASAAHSHFICDRCGAMIEAPDELFGGLARTAKARLGFTIDPHHFAILGRCAGCQ